MSGKNKVDSFRPDIDCGRIQAKEEYPGVRVIEAKNQLAKIRIIGDEYATFAPCQGKYVWIGKARSMIASNRGRIVPEST